MAWTIKCDDGGTPREVRPVFATSYSSPSFTPAANAILFALISNHTNETAQSISGHDSGTGAQAWTHLSGLQFTDGGGGSNVHGSIWMCMAPDSPSADTVDFVWDGGGSSARGINLICEVNGHDTGETLANLVVQSDSNTGNGTNFTLGLSGAISALTAGNLLLSIGYSGDSEVQFAPVSPFAEDFETAGSSSYEIAVHSSETSDTTPEMSVTANSEYAGMVVLELLASGGGGGGSVHFSIDPRKRGRAVL